MLMASVSDDAGVFVVLRACARRQPVSLIVGVLCKKSSETVDGKSMNRALGSVHLFP